MMKPSYGDELGFLAASYDWAAREDISPLEMALNGSGIRDIVRGLNVSPTTVISTLKKGTRAAIRE